MEISNSNFDIQSNMVKDNKTSNINQRETKCSSENRFSKYINANVNKKQQSSVKKEEVKNVDKSDKIHDSKDISNDKVEDVTEASPNKDEDPKDKITNVVNNILSLIETLQAQPEVKQQLKDLIQALISGDKEAITAIDQINKDKVVNIFNNTNSNSSEMNSILKLFNTSTLEDGNSKNTLLQIESLLNKIVNESPKANESSLGVAKNDNFSTLENDLISKIRANLNNKLIDEQASGNHEGVVQREPLNGFKPHINIYDRNSLKNGVDEKSLVKEDNLLEKLAEGEKNDSKISRISNFLTTLNDNKINLNSSAINKNTPVFISKGTFNEDVVKAIKFMNLNDIKDLSVKIYPKELGEVVISVSMEQGGLKAVIKAANKDTVDLLNLGLRDINEKLSQNNVKIQSLDIGLYNEDTTFFANGNKEQQQQQFNGRSSREFNFEVEDEQINEIVEDGAVNLLI